MRLSQIVDCYQKKIGSYDKQEWEKTLEQKILLSALNLPLKSTKVKTELIDVDLVRGSTFPKAKPKQSLLTVFYLSILRSLFLPLYAKWFLRSTSPKIFVLLLFLYIIQLVNWAIYSLNVSRGDLKGATVKTERGTEDDYDEHVVALSELLIPMGLSMLLCFIHSQIVATYSNSTRSSSQRKNNVNPNSRRHNPDKLKRTRKKAFRRSTNKKEHSSGSDDEHRIASKKSSSSSTNNNNNKINQTRNKSSAPQMPNHQIKQKVIANEQSQNINNVVIKTKNKLNFHEQTDMVNQTNDNDVAESSVPVRLEVKPISGGLRTSPNLRKRNVNFDTSVRSQLVDEFERLQNIERANQANPAVNVEAVSRSPHHPTEDDGFESYNTGKSSSGEDNNVMRVMFQNKLLNNSEDSDTDTLKNSERSTPVKVKSSNSIKSNSKPATGSSKTKESSDTDEENNEDAETLSRNSSNHQFTETEYIGVTTNSDYSSEIDQSESQLGDDLEFDVIPTTILNPNQDSSERVSCTIWTKQHEVKKADMSVLDISSAIIERVEGIPETCDYVYIGLVLSLLLSLTPSYCRMCERAVIELNNSTEIPKMLLEVPKAILLERNSYSYLHLLDFAFGKSSWEKTILVLSFVQRLILTSLFFFLLAVAERTFKQRFLYAKLFSHLTSSRRARKSDIPHFRLNKVKHIKAWLSVRSYLKRLGPQRSVDIIVSATFITTLFLLAFLSLEFLKDSEPIHSLNLEALMWSCSLGTFLLRFMTLGTKINKKYRSISVLITEQINLYVQIEQKPQKKEELMISNSVLKLAADLLKELESPFKISGLSANSYLYNTVKVVILSALSGVLSEMLGFKLKLHKIKIK